MSPRRRRPDRPFEELLDRAITRRPRGLDVPDDPREMVRRLESVLGSRRAVAERLGTSLRTVQRWLSERAPGGLSRRSIQRVIQTFTTAPEIRAAAVSPRRVARIRNRGMRLIARGMIGVVHGTGDQATDYRRHRTINVAIPGEAAGPIIDAWLAGDSARARALLEDALDVAYVADFKLNDRLDRLDFRRW